MLYNNRIYSLASLILFLAIVLSLLEPLHLTSVKAILCSSPPDRDEPLRHIFHISKLYEYIDIFNVLAVGGLVNTHFWVHHFTVSPAIPDDPLLR
jgi:hypothetical protein